MATDQDVHEGEEPEIVGEDGQTVDEEEQDDDDYFEDYSY